MSLYEPSLFATELGEADACLSSLSLSTSQQQQPEEIYSDPAVADQSHTLPPRTNAPNAEADVCPPSSSQQQRQQQQIEHLTNIFLDYVDGDVDGSDGRIYNADCFNSIDNANANNIERMELDTNNKQTKIYRFIPMNDEWSQLSQLVISTRAFLSVD